MILNYFKALPAKTVLIFSAFFIFILIVLATSVYIFTLGVMEKENNRVINIEYEYLINTYLSFGTQRLIVNINQRSKNQNTAIYLTTDPAYNKLAGNLNSWPEEKLDNDGYITFEISRSLGSDIITHLCRAKIIIFNNGTKLLVGRDIQPEVLISKALINLTIFTIIFIIIAALIGSALFGRYSLTKIDILNKAIQKITDNDLVGRINNNKIDSEYKQISSNVNRMLKRIDELVENSKNISGNIAHDLKKPLTRLKSNLELASLKSKNFETENSINIDKALLEADNLIKIFNALLDIASFESEKKQNFNTFNLSKSIESLASIYLPVFEDNQIKFKINIEKNIKITGNNILLTQAFTNILDNSIKYLPKNDHKEIYINLYKEDKNILLNFSDNGEGIDKKDYNRVFDRFVRLEKHRQTDGNGLGLSMVKAILNVHKASITLSNNKPGLIVNIKFSS